MTSFIKAVTIVFALLYLSGCGSSSGSSNSTDTTPVDEPDTAPTHQPGDVLNSIPFPNGISFIGDIVYDRSTNTIWITAGNSTTLSYFIQMDTSGNVVKTIANNNFWINHGSELSFDGINLWATSYGWSNGIPQSYIFQLDLNGNIINQFLCPAMSTDGFCEGIIWDGQFLWSASSDNKNLVKFTTTGVVEATFVNEFPTVGTNTYLLFDNSNSLLIALHDGGINMINPTTGQLTIHNIPSFWGRTSGWDGANFWQADNSKLQIDVVYSGL